MLPFIGIHTAATLVVYVLAHVSQSNGDNCEDFCRSKYIPGTTGEYHVDCGVSGSFTSITANFCLGECYGKCPSDRCPGGTYVVCQSPQAPSSGNDEDMNMKSSSDSILTWVLIGFGVLLLLLCCVGGGCFWYYYSSRQRLRRGNGQQQWQSQTQPNFSQQPNQYPPPPQQNYQQPPPPSAPITVSSHYTTPTGDVQRI